MSVNFSRTLHTGALYRITALGMYTWTKLFETILTNIAMLILYTKISVKVFAWHVQFSQTLRTG